MSTLIKLRVTENYGELDRLHDGQSAPVPVVELERYIESLIPLHKAHWRKNVAEPGASRLLVADAITRLEMLRLAVLDADQCQVRPLPAIGRFALGPPRTASAVEETNLWEHPSP